MSGVMKALFFDGKEFSLREVPVPERKEGESLIRVIKVGICNTDIEILKGYMSFRGILGHEFVGVVVDSDKKDLLGKRVVGEINISCGGCDLCRAGLKKHCRNIKTLGIKDWDGAMAEYLKLPDENLYVVPDDIDDLSAVFVEPLAAAIQVLEDVHIKPTHNVCVVGDGKLGLLITKVLTFCGYSPCVLGHHPERKKIVPKVSEYLLSEDFREDGVFDIVIEATGNEKGFETAVRIVKPRGVIVLKSTFHGDFTLNLSPVVIKEVGIVGSRCGPFPMAIRFLSDGLEVKDMVEGVYSLEDAERAFKEARGKLKVILSC